MKKILLIFLGLILSLTLFACQDRKIKYNDDDCFVAFYVGRKEETPVSIQVKKGTKIEEPKLKTKSGIIVGWYTNISFDRFGNPQNFDEANRWDFANNTVSSNTTLYAKIEKKIITIVYHLEHDMTFSATGEADPTQLDKELREFDYSVGINDLPRVDKPGYKFHGFFTKPMSELNGETDVPFSTILALEEKYLEINELHLYPILKPRQITLVLFSDTGNSSILVTFNKAYSLPKLDSYNGKAFLGWYTRTAKPEDSVKVPDEGTWIGCPCKDNGVLKYDTNVDRFILIAKFES